MRTRTLIRAALAAALLVAAAGCATGPYGEGRRLAEQHRWDEAVDRYYEEIAADPASARAWREIGVARYEQGDLAGAEEALRQAARIDPDARTHLYLGLVHEGRDENELALSAYRAALGMDPSRRTRELVEAYLDVLVRRQVEQDVQRALAGEEAIDPAAIPENTVAVAPFDASQLPPDLAPLGLGLTEFTAQDLAKIGSLRVVDRLKIDAVRRELALARSDLVDPATAPRVGRLVGGRRLVTGSLLGIGDDRIRLSGAVVDAVDRSRRYPEDADGRLEDFFRVQKDFVFRVVDELGITLTPEEREAIQEVPTESYVAFMAYCRGLELQDAGQLPAAQAQFRSAVRADAGFAPAARAGRSVSARLSAGLTGGGLDTGRFAAAVTQAAEMELTGGALADFQGDLLRLQSFVPWAGDIDLLGLPVDAPPRTGDYGQAEILIRGNLDGGL